tara:strand:+ start:374 stop:577 length:204 start_codon:yes stop_codon:yes gene_type:complete
MTKNQEQALQASLIASVELEELRVKMCEQRNIIDSAKSELWRLNNRFQGLNEVINKNLNLVLMKENI